MNWGAAENSGSNENDSSSNDNNIDSNRQYESSGSNENNSCNLMPVLSSSFRCIHAASLCSSGSKQNNLHMRILSMNN